MRLEASLGDFGNENWDLSLPACCQNPNFVTQIWYQQLVSPIYPLEGQTYVEPVYNEGQGDYLDQIYNVTAMQEDYVNPKTDGNLSWKSASSSTSDSWEALEN